MLATGTAPDDDDDDGRVNRLKRYPDISIMNIVHVTPQIMKFLNNFCWHLFRS